MRLPVNQTVTSMSTVAKNLTNICVALDESSIVAITDKHGTITYVNKKFCEISKYPKYDLIGQNHRILKSGFHSPEFFKQMWKTITSGRIWKGEIKNKAKDGTSYWVKTTIVPIMGKNGMPEQYIAIRTDITREKNMAEHLRKALDLVYKTKNYVNIYENSPDLFRTIDTEGNIIDCNISYAHSLGYSEEEILGMTIFDHTAKESIQKTKQSFEEWKKTGTIQNYEIVLKRKDGSTFPAIISATSLYDDLGKLLGSNTVIKDVTNIHKFRNELESKDQLIRNQLEELKILSRQKDEFLTMISHELKTPLTPIKGYSDILLSSKFGQLSAKQTNALHVIKTSAEYMNNLISDLLDVHKFEIGEIKMDKKVQKLSEVIEKTLFEQVPQISKHGIEITTDMDPSLCCSYDEKRIRQVLRNLINNAIDFCPKQNGRIHIKLCSKGSCAKIIVMDNGIGIQKQKLDKIFVKFYQADTTTTRDHGGTGLGLSVCKNIIGSHDGKIWAESEGAGHGAEIHILLPLQVESITTKQ